MANKIVMKKIELKNGDLIAHQNNDSEIFMRIKMIDTVTNSVTLIETETKNLSSVPLSMLQAGIESKTYAHYTRVLIPE